MVKRYRYTAAYATHSGGGFDDDGNAIESTITWNDFSCDIQSSGGTFSAGEDGDKLKYDYKIYANISDHTFLDGDQIRINSSEICTIKKVWDYSVNVELWVGKLNG